MSNIEKDLGDIDEDFWNSYKLFIKDEKNNIKNLLNKTSNSNLDKVEDNWIIDYKDKLNDQFNLMLFIIKQIEDIVKDNCNNSLHILNIMCVYSYVCKEFNIGLTELKDKKRRDFNESKIVQQKTIDATNTNFNLNININISINLKIYDEIINDFMKLFTIFNECFTDANQLNIKKIEDTFKNKLLTCKNETEKLYLKLIRII